MNVNYAKFQKSLMVEQFQGNYLKLYVSFSQQSSRLLSQSARARAPDKETTATNDVRFSRNT